MQKSTLKNKKEIEDIRHLLAEIGDSCSISDFEEHVQTKAVLESMRLWRDGGMLVGFGYVDDYCNLWFETKNALLQPGLEGEIITWGIRCLQLRNSISGTNDSLDHCCSAANTHRRVILLRNGFNQGTQRSLTFVRYLREPVQIFPYSPGYTWRSVNQYDSIESLVELHQAAFGTENMTVEYRLAMMNIPQYQQDLDLVAVAPDGSLAAFCVCGFDDETRLTGYTDPIGTHPDHQQKGLAKSLVSTGMMLLANSGAQKVELGTSSENIPMQKLALSLGFNLTAEKLWFSKDVPSDLIRGVL
jgi:ribosomal protein S18 acetylase RimI-like enzyme